MFGGTDMHFDKSNNEELERERINELIRGMDRRQLKMVVDAVPPELCYKRVGIELERMKKQLDNVKGLMEV